MEKYIVSASDNWHSLYENEMMGQTIFWFWHFSSIPFIFCTLSPHPPEDDVYDESVYGLPPKTFHKRRFSQKELVQRKMRRTRGIIGEKMMMIIKMIQNRRECMKKEKDVNKIHVGAQND